jgi:hypothetical protein
MQDSKPYFTKSNYAPVAGFRPERLARLFSNCIFIRAPVDGLRPCRFALLFKKFVSIIQLMG